LSRVEVFAFARGLGAGEEIRKPDRNDGELGKGNSGET